MSEDFNFTRSEMLGEKSLELAEVGWNLLLIVEVSVVQPALEIDDRETILLKGKFHAPCP